MIFQKEPAVRGNADGRSFFVGGFAVSDYNNVYAGIKNPT